MGGGLGGQVLPGVGGIRDLEVAELEEDVLHVGEAQAYVINGKLTKNNVQNWFGYFVWLEFILINFSIHFYLISEFTFN